MREEEKGVQRVIVRRERTLSDNVEAVQGETDNPKSTCSSIALTFQEAQHGRGEQSLEPGETIVFCEDSDQSEAWSLEQGAEGGDPGDPARWHV